jgi:hypothetical protein
MMRLLHGLEMFGKKHPAMEFNISEEQRSHIQTTKNTELLEKRNSHYAGQEIPFPLWRLKVQ